jgi:hypothetical protein
MENMLRNFLCKSCKNVPMKISQYKDHGKRIKITYWEKSYKKILTKILADDIL